MPARSVHELTQEAGTRPQSHTRSLIRLLGEREQPLRNAIEIGVFKGLNAYHLLKAFPRMFLTLVDSYKAFVDDGSDNGMKRSRFAKLSQQELNVIKTEAAVLLSTVTDSQQSRIVWHYFHDLAIAKVFVNDPFDFVFLDHGHDKKCMQASLPVWWNRVAHGGLYAGHDYNGRGDKRGDWGVKSSVDAWAKKMKLEVHTKQGHVWYVNKPPEGVS